MSQNKSHPYFVNRNLANPRQQGLPFLARSAVHISRNAKEALLNPLPCYDHAVKFSGNVLQMRQYEKPQFQGYQRKPSAKPKRTLTTEEQLANQKKAGLRATAKLHDLINSNFGMCQKGFLPGRKSLKFLTLTYKENMQDRDEAAKDLERFVKRLEYRLQEKIQYTCIPEPQKRGAWHFHLLVNCSFIPLHELKAIWNAEYGQGSFKIQRINRIRNIGKYCAKYMTKEFDNVKRLDTVKYKKRFWTSRGLKDKTVTVKVKQPRITMDDVLQRFKNLLLAYRIGEYTGEYTGKVRFLELILKPCEKVKEYLQQLQCDLCPSPLSG